MEKKRAERVTVPVLWRMKDPNDELYARVAALSLYDYPTTKIAERAGVDIAIVGDSLGMTKLGYKNTLPVTMDEMLVFASAVARAATRIFVVGDLPLGSYQPSDRDAVINATRFIKAGCTAVKCEASTKLISRFGAIADAEILVMGHIGLNPQKIHEMGGHRIQGKTIESTNELVDVAGALQDAGAFALLLEGVTEEVSGYIRSLLHIPVYGIDSGRKLDGQLLLGDDPLGMYEWSGRVPKYIKQWRPERGGKTVGELVFDIYSQYVDEVKSGVFPAEEHVRRVNMEDFKKSLDGAKVLKKIEEMNLC